MTVMTPPPARVAHRKQRHLRPPTCVPCRAAPASASPPRESARSLPLPLPAARPCHHGELGALAMSMENAVSSLPHAPRGPAEAQGASQTRAEMFVTREKRHQRSREKSRCRANLLLGAPPLPSPSPPPFEIRESRPCNGAGAATRGAQPAVRLSPAACPGGRALAVK